MDFNHYFSNEEVESQLTTWVAEHPDLASLLSIGSSYEKRPIWLLILTNQVTGPDLEKPAVWVDANIHATEIAGTTVAMYLVHFLLTGYAQDSRISRLLDTCTFYIVPRVNPDGAALAMSENPRFVRSGVRPYPWLDKEEGLHQQDVDGDGRILQMRIPDQSGDWKISSLDPRLLEKRAPDEHGGDYYRLLPEGMLEDYDGYLIKAARPYQGLDFNRNFPFEWRPENDQEGAGPYPSSEPEIKALLDFISAHPNINAGIAYHTFSRVILRPYGTKSDEEFDYKDLWVFKKIGEVGTHLTGYPCVSTFHDFKYHPKEVITGVFDDWMFDHLGAYSFTIELWDLPDEAGIKDRKFIEWYRDHPHTDDLKIIKWIDENIGDEAYIDWYDFKHPQLGKIELGGWNFMYTWRNPPHHLIAAEAQRNAPFVLALADMLPLLTLQTLEVKSLGNGDYHINLVVENTGYMPTFTSLMGKKRKAARPVRAELELSNGVRIVSGKRRIELGHLEGRSNKSDLAAFWNVYETDNRARAEWVLHAPEGGEITLHVKSDRGGSIHKHIQLGA